MEAKATRLLSLLRGNKQFYVPPYQRPYSWTTRHAEQLLSDVLFAAENPAGHFLGAVVTIERNARSLSEIEEINLIDGQQRLTTALLILIALTDSLGQTGKFSIRSVKADGSETETFLSGRSLREKYLVSREDGELHKLLLTQKDQATLIALLEGRSVPDQRTPLTENLQFLKQAIRTVPPETLYTGLSSLMVVRIALERGVDDPQLIYESMNSTGLDLTQSDLIRNYVLMNLPPAEQQTLHRDAWVPLEERFDPAQPKEFDRFVRDYVSLRSGETPVAMGDVYAAFKRYARLAGDNSALARDMSRVGQQYAALLHPETFEPDPQVRQALAELKEVGLEATIPVLLQAQLLRTSGQLPQEAFLSVIGLLRNLMLRRQVVGLNTAGISGALQTVTRQTEAERYLPSLTREITQLRGSARFPRDPEFKEALLRRDVYQTKKICKYLLTELENAGQREQVNCAQLQIEHILPQTQNLGAEWRAELGADWADIQSRLVHTLGNLTLTGYNPQLSARPFSEKRFMDGGYAQSPLRLNKAIAALDRWTETEILARGERLAARALNLWPAPAETAVITEPLLVSEDRRARSFSVDYHLVGASPELRMLVHELRSRLLELDVGVTEHPMKVYVGYKFQRNFFDFTVQPGLNLLKCWVNTPYELMHAANLRLRNVTNIGHHGNGDVEFILRPGEDLGWAMTFIRDSLQRQQ